MYVEVSLVFAIALGLGAAIFLQTLQSSRKILRTILLMPWALSMGVIGVLWTWLLNPSYGPVEYLMPKMGLGASLLLGDPRLAMPLLILITVWWSFPFAMVMGSAAIEGIPRDYYEAVDLDGGGQVAGFRCVTWPFVLPTMRRCALVLSILFLTLVTLILVVTGGGPLGTTATWSLEAFRSGVQDANVSKASVFSVFVLGANLSSRSFTIALGRGNCDRRASRGTAVGRPNDRAARRRAVRGWDDGARVVMTGGHIDQLSGYDGVARSSFSPPADLRRTGRDMLRVSSTESRVRAPRHGRSRAATVALRGPRWRFAIRQGCIGLVLFLFVFLPLLWTLMTSFKTEPASVSYPPTLWPHPFTLENYRTVFSYRPFLRELSNSIVYSVGRRCSRSSSSRRQGTRPRDFIFRPSGGFCWSF